MWHCTAVKTQQLTVYYTSVSFVVSLSMTVVLHRSSTSARMSCDSSQAQRQSGIQGCSERLLRGTVLRANKIVVPFIGGNSTGTKLSYGAMCNWELYLLCVFFNGCISWLLTLREEQGQRVLLL